MIFDLVMEDPHDSTKPFNRRTAIRAVVFKDGKCLMVESNQGDVKLPGGGLEDGETIEEALKREVKEETGYAIVVEEKIGKVLQLKPDFKDARYNYAMMSLYYRAVLTGHKAKQALSLYEKALDMKPIWITVEDAIIKNESCVSKMNWVNREITVLKILRDKYKEK